MSAEKSIIVDNWVISGDGTHVVAHRTANSRDHASMHVYTLGSRRADKKLRLELAGKSAVKIFNHIANGGGVGLEKNKLVLR